MFKRGRLWRLWSKNFADFSLGKPIPGTGAGLRPLGKDPNFAKDLRENFNITIPILHEDDKNDAFKNTDHTGNGKNKWPNPELVNPDWKHVVSIILNCWQIFPKKIGKAYYSNMIVILKMHQFLPS